MSLSPFDGSGAFDAVAWVNTELAQAGCGEALDVHIAELLLRLQLTAQGINTRVEEGMARLLGSIPRALREVERLSRDSDSLQRGLGVLAAPLATADPAAVETLQHLHRIRSNVDASLAVLERTAAWERLAEEVEQGFSARDLVAVAERLGALRAGLAPLAGMPDAERRAELVPKMEQRLETLIGPGLRKAVARYLEDEYEQQPPSQQGLPPQQQQQKREQQDQLPPPQQQQQRLEGSAASAASLRGLVSIFSKLGRLEHLRRDFCAARASLLHDEWERSRNESLAARRPAVEWAAGCLDAAGASLEREVPRCERLFGSALQARLAVRQVASELLGKAGPGLAAEVSLASLADLFALVCAFVDRVARATVLAEPRGEGEAEVLAGALDSLDAGALSPFAAALDAYRGAQGLALTQRLQQQAGGVTAQTLPAMLGDPACTALVQHAIRVCERVAGGALAAELAAAADAFWSDFLARCLRALPQSLPQAQAQPQSQPQAGSRAQASDGTHAALRNLHVVAGFCERLALFKVAMAADVARMLTGPVAEDCAGRMSRRLRERSSALCSALLAGRDAGQPPAVALAQVWAASAAKAEELGHAAQAAAYEAMMAPMRTEWASLSQQRVWALESEEEGARQELLSEFGGPLKYMTRITKHLVTLVELLEPFASPEPLRVGLVPDALRLGERERSALERALHLPVGVRAAPAVLPDAEALPEDLFSPPWLRVVAVGAANAVMLEALQVPRLGMRGAKQLAADVACLANVLEHIAGSDALLADVQAALELLDASPAAPRTLAPLLAQLKAPARERNAF
jgi:hypothetical protein